MKPRQTDRAPILPNVLAVLLLLLVGAIASAWILGSLLVRGSATATGDPAAPARRITLSPEEGIAIRGFFWPGREINSPAVLVLHGVGSSQASVANTAAWLSSQGYAALTIDFRGHGGSTITDRSFGWAEAKDAQAAFAWLKRSDPHRKVAIVGISMGGAASLLGPSGPIPADALVLQAVYPDIRRAIRNRIASRLPTVAASMVEPVFSLQAYSRFGVGPERLSPIAALHRFRGPVLIVGGAEDRYTPPKDTLALFQSAPARRELWLVPGLDHDAVCTLATPAYRTRLSSFLRRTIGPPSSTRTSSSG